MYLRSARILPLDLVITIKFSWTMHSKDLWIWWVVEWTGKPESLWDTDHLWYFRMVFLYLWFAYGIMGLGLLICNISIIKCPKMIFPFGFLWRSIGNFISRSIARLCREIAPSYIRCKGIYLEVCIIWHLQYNTVLYCDFLDRGPWSRSIL
jgi:hypothetical protein